MTNATNSEATETTADIAKSVSDEALQLWARAARSLMYALSPKSAQSFMPSLEPETVIYGGVINMIGRVSRRNAWNLPEGRNTEFIQGHSPHDVMRLLETRQETHYAIIASIAIQISEGHPDIEHAIEVMIEKSIEVCRPEGLR